jgi:hypothetical protein
MRALQTERTQPLRSERENNPLSIRREVSVPQILHTRSDDGQ